MKKLLSFLMLAGVCLNAELTLMQKVADERKPIIQPIQQEQPPEGAKEEVYIDESPELSPTVQESMLGMILFQRPLTNPLWPSTKPQAFERVERLDDWGAQGQYVTINFAVYPLKELKNLRIQVLHSSIKPEIRLVRYWNIIYPNYNFVPVPQGDYLLCGHLLDRKIDAFALAVKRYYDLDASLPKHYREALVLYNHIRSNPVVTYKHEVADADYADFQKLMRECGSNKTRLRDVYGNTYWYYYYKNN